jgi:beta-lactam-binding protein with PASTA domain
MIESGLPLLSSHPFSRIVGLVGLVACLLLAGHPVLADTSTPSTPSAKQRVYTPALITVQVPDLRKRVLPEAQKLATDAQLRLVVSGEAPADPGKAVVVRQTPEPNTSVAIGTVVTVVVHISSTPPTGTTGDGSVPSRVTIVPDLLQRSLTEARPLMEKARLRLEVSGGAPEDTSHAIVVSQSPSAGARAPVGSAVIVTVQVRRSDDMVVVPELRPRPLAEAQRVLSAARLKLEVSGGWPADASRATVSTQKPSPGTRVPVASPVVVTVQMQTPPVPEVATVPELRRLVLLDAQRRVTRARLRLQVAGGWPADPLLATVVEQKPGPETRVPVDSVVEVVVRNLAAPPPAQPPPPAPPQIVGPPIGVSPPRVVTPPDPPTVDQWVLVPALRQRPLMDALQRVRGARLRLEVTGGWPSDPERAVVFEQQPAPDTRVRISSTVTVQISPPQQALQPPPPPTPPVPPTPPAPPRVVPPPAPPRAELVAVPDLRQQPLPEARQLTTSARLELRVLGQGPADEARAIVVSQRPEAGARVAVRSVILVELGPALLVVPDLRQHPLDEARRIVSEAGFAIAVMGDPPSNESRAQVVEQSPLPGARVAAGSTVTVRARVSRVTTWVIAGAGALLAAAGAAFGVARWRGVGSHPTAGLPGVRVVARGDLGKQEIRSNGAAAEGFALRLRSRIDPGAQTVEASAAIIVEERRIDA